MAQHGAIWLHVVGQEEPCNTRRHVEESHPCHIGIYIHTAAGTALVPFPSTLLLDGERPCGANAILWSYAPFFETDTAIRQDPRAGNTYNFGQQQDFCGADHMLPDWNPARTDCQTVEQWWKTMERMAYLVHRTSTTKKPKLWKGNHRVMAVLLWVVIVEASER